MKPSTAQTAFKSETNFNGLGLRFASAVRNTGAVRDPAILAERMANPPTARMPAEGTGSAIDRLPGTGDGESSAVRQPDLPGPWADPIRAIFSKIGNCQNHAALNGVLRTCDRTMHPS